VAADESAPIEIQAKYQWEKGKPPLGRTSMYLGIPDNFRANNLS
jgi:hypothetical protein